MGYSGATLFIPCDKGGLTYNKNSDLILPQMMVRPTRNITLNEGGRRKRGGTAKINSTAVSGSPRIMGGFDFQLPSTSYQVFLGADGALYSSSTVQIKTGMSTVNYPSFDVFAGELYVCDGDTTPQTWNGVAASTSNITTPASDWSGSDQPFQVIAHGRGESRRMWFLMGSTLYYSSLDNGKVVQGGTAGFMTIRNIDAKGLTAGVEFQDRLFVFSRTKTYLIDDSDPDTTNWGYASAAWEGGAAHWRVIVKTPNDLIVMGEDGTIYSISAVQSYGDYKQASLTKPAFIDNYIRDNVDLGKIDQFHGVFDPVQRACYFWVVRQGQLTCDTALVYYIDRPVEEAWVIHDGQASWSAYKASCSFLTRASAGSYLVYTGDYSGFIGKLNQSTRTDDGSAYYGGFRIPPQTMGNPRVSKHFKRVRLTMQAQGNFNMTVSAWVDGRAVTGGTISMTGTGAVLGAFVLGVDVLGGITFIDAYLGLNVYGKRLELEFYNSGASQDFFISSVMIDYRKLGATL